MEFEKMTVEYVDPKKLRVFDYSRELFPKLEGAAYEFLRDDIKENGIRTPLEVTKENLILCGHERHRVALELGLAEVPVIYFSNCQVVDQKIRCIKDNLARKAVDHRTKIRCYGELRDLYSLKQGQTKTSYVDTHGCITTENDDFMTHAEMAKEVGLKERTADYALSIERSDLPEEIKAETFKGRLGIRPVADLIREPDEVKAKAIPKILAEIEGENEHIFVQNIVDAEKDRLQDVQINSLDKALEVYEKALLKISPRGENESNQEFLEKATAKAIRGLIRKHGLVCPACGKNLKELV